MTPTASPVDILKWLRTTNRSRSLTPAEKSIAVEIASRINSGTGVCFPNLQTIADAVGLCLSLVKRAVRKLIEMGMLAVRHTGRSNIYSLRGLPGCTSDSHERRPRRTKQKNETSPLPPEGKESLELKAEIAPAQPPVLAELQIEDNTLVESEAAPSAALSEPETTPELVPAPTAPAKPETASEAVEAPASPDEITALIAYFWTISGTKADSVRHRKALQQALKCNTSSEIKQAAKVAKDTWSNPHWITPSAICKPGRIDELLSQGRTAQKPAAAAHRPFSELKLRLPQAYVEAHKHQGEGLREADERLLFEIRTGRRPAPQSGELQQRSDDQRGCHPVLNRLRSALGGG